MHGAGSRPGLLRRIALRWPVDVIAAVLLVGAAADLTAAATEWGASCLGMLVTVGALLGVRSGHRHRAVVLSLGVVAAAQPILHLAAEASHRMAPTPEGGSKLVHLGLFVVHLLAVALAVLVVAVADLAVLALTDSVHRLVRLLAVLRSTTPEYCAPRRPATDLADVAIGLVWAAYAVRRGPPPCPA